MSNPPSPSRKTSHVRPTRFRFKSSHKRDISPSVSQPAKRHESSSRQHSGRRRRHRTRSLTPPELPPLSPNSAFRESLFDALADDEGAAYWESVYGQPIHTYPHPRRGTSSGVDDDASHDENDKPILERMSDDEYASYVRAQMWKKSHSYITEERKRRDQAREDERRRKKEDEQKSASWREQNLRIENLMDESVARARRRKTMAEWKEIWECYRRAWEDLRKHAESPRGSKQDPILRKRLDITEENTRCTTTSLPWPVKSGRSRDIGKTAVEEFMRFGPVADHSQEGFKETDLLAVLKIERVRWHPDRVMRLCGCLGLQQEALKKITQIFQIIDSFWAEVKKTVDSLKVNSAC